MYTPKPSLATPVDAVVNARREVVIMLDDNTSIIAPVHEIDTEFRYLITRISNRVWDLWVNSQEQMEKLGFAITTVGAKSRMTFRPSTDPVHELRCRDEYRYIDAQFQSGFDPDEVLELCEEFDMPRVDAVILTHFWMLQNDQVEPFDLDCAEAERYFRSDGTLNLEEYIAASGGKTMHPTFL